MAKEKKEKKEKKQKDDKSVGKKAVEGTKSFWRDFGKFLARGNVLDMAVGVVIGAAFSAIVTAVVSILLAVCTWQIPGGIKGWVTVLPAANSSQAGVEGIGQWFTTDSLTANVFKFANMQGADVGSIDVGITDAAGFGNMQTALLGKYTLHGGKYIYNSAAILDWGTLVNAVISFLVIAFVLFLIIRVVAKVAAKNAELKAKAKEEYYKKHPEERPVEPAPEAPKPTTEELLGQILAELKKKDAAK